MRGPGPLEAASPPVALGGWMAAALVVGNMIGSGVFLLPAALAAYGGISLLGWVFTAAGATVLALLFARLARLVPRSGGPYAYTQAAFGDFAGFLVAWGYWISIVVANAALAVAMTSYLSWFLPVVGESRLLATGIAVGTVWLLTAVNVSGARNAGGVQLITTLLKIAPLVALGIFGLVRLDPEHFQPFNLSGGSPFGAVTAAATLTLFAFLGFESATVPAEEVKDPGRTIPRATVAGTLVAALVYIVSTIGVMGLIAPSELAVSGAPFGDAARVLWGQGAGAIVSAGAVISCFGALNGWILLQGRVPHAAARDGLFPAVFGRLSARGTPANGLVLSSLVVTALLLLNASEGLVRQFEFLILLSTLTALFPYALCAVAEPLLRFRDPERFATGRPSAVPWLALTGFAYALWAIAGAGMPTVYWGFLLLMLGVPVYGRMISARGG